MPGECGDVETTIALQVTYCPERSNLAGTTKHLQSARASQIELQFDRERVKEKPDYPAKNR